MMYFYRKRKVLLFMAVCLGLMFCMTGTSHAQDVYVCNVDDYEVYVDTSSIMGSPWQIVVVNGVKFVVDGQEKTFATAKFYNNNGIWWGNIAIRNIPTRGDYPVQYDEVTMAIFNVVRQYV